MKTRFSEEGWFFENERRNDEHRQIFQPFIHRGCPAISCIQKSYADWLDLAWFRLFLRDAGKCGEH
jgi:hypothetical protein